MIERLNIEKEKKELLPPGRIDQSLSDYFKENDVEAPPVQILILFSSHNTESDAAWMEPYYKETDIFIPEMANWSPAGTERYVKVARGSSDAKEIVKTYKSRVLPNFSTKLMEILERNPGKLVCFVDIEKGTEISGRSKLSLEAMYKGRDSAQSLPFQQRAQVRAQADNLFAKNEKIREEHMVITLPQSLGNLIRENPELSKKEKLKVLMQLGSVHTRVYKFLENRGENVSREFKELPEYFVGGGIGIATRAESFGKELTPEDHQKLVFAELLDFKFLNHLHHLLSESEFKAYLKLIMTNFSLKEMEILFKEINLGSTDAQKNFQKLLKRKNIPVIIDKPSADIFRKWLSGRFIKHSK